MWWNKKKKQPVQFSVVANEDGKVTLDIEWDEKYEKLAADLIFKLTDGRFNDVIMNKLEDSGGENIANAVRTTILAKDVMEETQEVVHREEAVIRPSQVFNQLQQG